MLGDYLRQKRLEAGLSLEEISKKTYIRKSYLEALEDEDYKFINGDVFVRGYIKAYLKALGVEPEEAIRLYEEDTKNLKQDETEETPQTPRTISMKLFAVPGTLVAIALIITIILLQYNQNESREPASHPENLLSEGINVVMPLDDAEARLDNKELLEINTLEETWIYLVIDENLKYSMLLEPGESKKWTAEKGFFLKIGNAGGIEITYNGIKYGPLGKRGQVIKLNLPDDLERLNPQKQASPIK